MKKTKILIAISNYNEENAIGDTIKDVLHNSTIEADILVIDNSSTDRSIEVIQQYSVNYLLHPVNTGGSAGVIKTAFAYAYYHNYDIYCHMDGDNQHKAEELYKIIEPLINGEGIDVVTGSRFIDKEGFQSSFSRRIGIYIFSKLISFITRSKFTDITSGFRAYNKNAIRFFAKNFKQEIETITQLELIMFYGGLKSKDVSVTMQARLTGKSEFDLINMIKFPVYNLVSYIGTIIQKI